MERVTGIEPVSSAWKAEALPLSNTRVGAGEGAGPSPGHNGQSPPHRRTGRVIGSCWVPNLFLWERQRATAASGTMVDPFGPGRLIQAKKGLRSHATILCAAGRHAWWALLDLNQRPPRCQRGALPLRQGPEFNGDVPCDKTQHLRK